MAMGDFSTPLEMTGGEVSAARYPLSAYHGKKDRFES